MSIGSLLRGCVCSAVVVGFSSVLHAVEVTLTVNEDAAIAAQLAAESKAIASGDTLIKAGSATLSVDSATGALLAGGTVEAGTLSVSPASGLGQDNARWTVAKGACLVAQGGSGYANTPVYFNLAGAGVNGQDGALQILNGNYQALVSGRFTLTDDATIAVNVSDGYSGFFSHGHVYLGGHALTLLGLGHDSQLRMRLGGSINGTGTIILDKMGFTSGGLADSNFSYDANVRTMKLVNGSYYKVNLQKQFDAYQTFDGEPGTTLQMDSGTMAATFKNLTGSPTLAASLSSVTITGIITVRGDDLVAGHCLDCRQPVTLGDDVMFDLAEDANLETGKEYALATATGGFTGALPNVIGRAANRRTVLRFSEDRKTLYATFGARLPDPDYGAVTAWYRFDVRPVGSTLADNAKVFNSVEMAQGVGDVQYLDATLQASTGVAPRIAQPSDLTEVYDPLTGVTFENTGALDFRTEVLSASSTKGAQVRIGGDGSNVLRNRSVTLEAFICSTGTVINLMAPIVSLTGGKGTTAETLALLVNNKGYICSRFQTASMSGQSAWAYTRTSGDPLFDGRWHHVALVYDMQAGTMTMYVDYKQDLSTPVSTDGLYFADSESINTVYIGGYIRPDARKFDGRIDEVRIVGAALTPEQFLRRRRPAAFAAGMTNANTLAFIPMALGTTGEGSLENVNLATATPPAYLYRYSAGSMLFSTNGPARGVRAGYHKTASIATGALVTDGAADATGTVIIQSGYTNYFADTFTLEGSFRTTKTQDAATIVSFDYASYYALKLMVHEGNKFYIAGNTPGWWGGHAGSAVVTDGAWHRFRLVYDHAAHQITLSLDGAKVFARGSLGEVAAQTRLVIGGCKHGEAALTQSFTGEIGPIRVTRGKLEPHACLSEVDPAEADATMRDGVAFQLRGSSAENLLDVTPYPASRTAPETATLTVADAAAPSFTPRVRRERLCPYGVEDGLVVTNTGSIHLQNSALVFRNQPALNTYPQTIEFLACFESIGASANLFRLAMNEGAAAENNAFRITGFFQNGTLRVGITTRNGNESGDTYFQTGVRISDLVGNWHHLAIVWDEDAAAGTTTFRSYLDYRLVREETDTYTIWHSTILNAHSLTIGYPSSLATEGLVCDIDEFRITAGALSPSSFIRILPSDRRFYILIR